MSSYTSLNSYLLAIKLRSAKTVLVEGVSDKKVLSRIFLEHHIAESNNPNFVIDDASIVNDNTHMPSFGNKQKVIAIGSSPNEKLTFLADREWDDWIFSPELKEEPQQNSHSGFFTRGHSIENYWFLEGALSEFLKNIYSEHLNVNYFSELSARFLKFAEFSAAYSLAVKDANVITKTNGLLKSSHITWTGSEYELNQSILSCLQSRQINIDIYSLFIEKYNLIKGAALDTLQWLSHGHLGEEALRCCAANLAIAHGVNNATIEAIERGYKFDKLCFDATYISQLPINTIEPIDKIISWIKE